MESNTTVATNCKRCCEKNTNLAPKRLKTTHNLANLKTALLNTLDQSYDETPITHDKLSPININANTFLYMYGNGGVITPKLLRILKHNIVSVSKGEELWTKEDAGLLDIIGVHFSKQKVDGIVRGSNDNDSGIEDDMSDTEQSLHKLMKFFNHIGAEGSTGLGDLANVYITEGFENNICKVFKSVIANHACTSKDCNKTMCHWKCDWELFKKCFFELCLMHQTQTYTFETEFGKKFTTICSEANTIMQVFGKHLSMVYIVVSVVCMVAHILKLYVSSWNLKPFTSSDCTTAVEAFFVHLTGQVRQELKTLVSRTFITGKSCYDDKKLLKYLDVIHSNMYVHASGSKNQTSTIMFALTFLYHLTMSNVCVISSRAHRRYKLPFTHPADESNVDATKYQQTVMILHDPLAAFYETFIMTLLDALDVPNRPNSSKGDGEIFSKLRSRCVSLKHMMIKTKISNADLTILDMSNVLSGLLVEFGNISKHFNKFVEVVKFEDIIKTVLQ